MDEDTQPMPDMAHNLRHLAIMDETIRAWRQRLADTQAQLDLHLAAKERYLQALTPSDTYYEPAPHRHPRLF